VAVEVHTDAPDRFTSGMRLFALAEDGTRHELKLEEHWPHKEWQVLKFAGVDSMSDAETLLGCDLQVPATERAQLEPGWTYISELVGCVVFDGEREVGKLEDVEFGAGEAPLLVVKAGANSYEVPFAEAYIKGVDLERRRIDMALPEGLLEINTPLTPEEKKQQHRGS
jgi:16S rRNA processing protein RimM